MALHSNETSITDLQTIYATLKSSLTDLKRKARSVSTDSNTQNTAIRDMIQVANRCKQVRDLAVLYRDTPGLEAFIRNVENDPTYNHATSTDQAVTAIDALVSQIFTNVPQNAGTGQFARAVFDYQINADGSTTALTITPAQAASLRTVITTFLANVN